MVLYRAVSLRTVPLCINNLIKGTKFPSFGRIIAFKDLQLRDYSSTTLVMEPEYSGVSQEGLNVTKRKRNKNTTRPEKKHKSPDSIVGTTLQSCTTEEKSRQPAIQRVFQLLIDEYFTETKFLMQKHSLPLLRAAMEKGYLRDRVLFLFDVEAWEKNNKLVTEVGIAIYDPRGQEFASTPTIKQIHIVIDEHKYKRNGNFVPDKKDRFGGNCSTLMSLNDTALFISSLMEHYFEKDGLRDKPSLFVGHQIAGDIKWLKSLGVEFPESFLPEEHILDTMKLFSLSHGRNGGSLKNVLKLVDIPHANLHNAGNDAYYTLLAALAWSDPLVRRLKGLDLFVPLSQEDAVLKKKVDVGKVDHSGKIWGFRITKRLAPDIAMIEKQGWEDLYRELVEDSSSRQ